MERLQKSGKRGFLEKSGNEVSVDNFWELAYNHNHSILRYIWKYYPQCIRGDIFLYTEGWIVPEKGKKIITED